MTTYFAFQVAEPTQQRIDRLLANLDSGSTAPQHELHTQVSVELVDEILRHGVEELTRLLQADGESAGILSTLLGLLKSTSHMLVRQMLGKGSNEDVARMAQYLRDRRLQLNGRTLFGFAVPEPLAGRFGELLTAAKEGRGEAHKAELKEVMLELSELALQRFYDDFVAPMELGFVKRKASELGRGTISKGLQMALGKLVPQLSRDELAVFARYYDGLLIKA